MQGKGEWVNTSTYSFNPDPALAGGRRYTIKLNPDLRGTDENPLEVEESWFFTTASPTLLSIEPFDGVHSVRLDPVINLTFSQPMNPESAGSNFTLTSNEGEKIAGQSSWDDSFTTLVFTPTVLLDRNASYTALLKAGAETMGGTPIDEQFQATWNTLPGFNIVASKPAQNGVTSIYSGVTLSLTSVLSPEEAPVSLAAILTLRQPSMALPSAVEVQQRLPDSLRYMLPCPSRICSSRIRMP